MILKKPLITETSYAGEAAGKYYFWVDMEATKTQIKAAFFTAFGVKPLAINTSITHGKVKSNPKTRQLIQKGDRKKAIISVPKGTKLDILSVAKANQ